MNASRIVGCYFVVQATLVSAWWASLLIYPNSIQWFQPSGWPQQHLLAFWLADGIMIVGGSLLVSLAVFQKLRWSGLAVWCVAAAAWYPTLVCMAASIATGESWIATSMMVSMAGLSLAMATIYGNSAQEPKTIRVTRFDAMEALIWTLGQTVIFWATFLWVLPLGIFELQDHLRLSPFEHSFQLPLSMVSFVTSSSLGIWSGCVMSVHGEGTPLPTATAPKLVVIGPYRYVRNPMALAGIWQGISVGWFLGSLPVIAYSLCGAVLWHICVRPVEERDLFERFGDSYIEYRKQVRLWIPRVN
ncbi:MAG: isoprenylcysteine carboxylmethyltransferase family protein [Planctomycetota bacterium]